MSEKEYRSFIGRIYAGPWDREVTTGEGVKTVIEYMASGPGINGDVEIKISFWDAAPSYVEKGVIVFVSGLYGSYKGKDKEGNEKITKTINANFCEKLGQNTLVDGKPVGTKAAPKRRVTVPAEVDIDDDLGF